jgi:hypothetical protein
VRDGGLPDPRGMEGSGPFVGASQCCTRVENSRRSLEKLLVSKGLASLEQYRLHLVRSTNTQLWQKARTGGGCSEQRL